ncbi:mandelate racemase/muconate lactonizing enzyme family protein [Jiangella asiatica]|uniref:Mandelate racemase/muconate lactonizing enzyme family protein n=1 Tax=Jiangella asiatica TaxID=2530372 RepID=A0A4R5D9Z2_9ACTN|nr:mandelate racemase/muconate lactonizing enzyme family protein [Jiangella asiatica]TDE10432.1 mandelate racemase/muconate lactonizing enzyme family protein [Jiangella asiatica]
MGSPDGAVVTSMETRLLRVPLRRPWGPDVPRVHVIVVEVTTSDGGLGTGFSWTPTIGARAVQALLDDECAAFVVGGPADPAAVWDGLWRHLHEAGGGGITTIAMAGIDLALWDLHGKRLGASLVDVLGRRRDFVEVYGSGVNLHYSLDDLVAQATRWVEAGHGAVKMKVGKPDLDEDIERVAAVREVIGPRRRLMIDANQRWDLPTARRAVAALSRFDLYWVEEPLLADATWAYAQLRAAVDVPIALGENAHTIHRFRDLLDAGACDVVQPNVVRVGGVTPFLRIASLARTYGVSVAPHLLPDLSGQLALCLPDDTLVEDVEDASFPALGCLAAPSPVAMSAGRLTADAAHVGLGLTFRPATDSE